jgi:formylglycine-generating enzyme required for sulfatase activity
MSLILAKGIEMEFVCIPEGEFWMGSDKKQDPNAQDHELPQHEVYLDEYWIGRYPVTNLQYQVFVQATGHAAPPGWRSKKIPKGKEQHPVVNMSWQDAAAFCQWASQTTGQKIRLPSEAEWEKAARGADGRLYPWGNQPPTKQLCHFGKLFGDTKPVGQFSPQGDSPYGCADMAGNVWEWVADWYSDTFYSIAPSRNPIGPDTGGLRVLRGGSWDGDGSYLRAANRYSFGPTDTLSNGGFRCSRSR